MISSSPPPSHSPPTPLSTPISHLLLQTSNHQPIKKPPPKPIFLSLQQPHNLPELFPLVLSVRQTALSYLYNYFLTRLDEPIRILIDEAHAMTDFPTKCPADFELLRMISGTFSERRWWRINVHDLTCLECVADLKMERARASVQAYRNRGRQKAWFCAVLGAFEKTERNIDAVQRVLGFPKENAVGLSCDHVPPTVHNVTKFFMQFGLQNTYRFENIELDIPPSTSVHPVDLEVLSCAVQTFRLYFSGVRRLRVVFHLPEAYWELDAKSINRIVGNLRRLEDLVANEAGRMEVLGFERHEVLLKAWNKGRKHSVGYYQKSSKGSNSAYGCLMSPFRTPMTIS